MGVPVDGHPNQQDVVRAQQEQHPKYLAHRQQDGVEVLRAEVYVCM